MARSIIELLEDLSMEKLGKILEQLIERRKHLSRLKIFHIRGLWEEIVGEVIASKARVVNYLNGELTIECSDPLWMAEIELRKDYLVKKINEKVGKDIVKKIIVRRG